MGQQTYVARFAAPQGEFYSTAIGWPAAGARLLPAGWARTWSPHLDVDLSLRVCFGLEPRVVALLTSGREETLRTRLSELEAQGLPPGSQRPQDSAAFDALAVDALPAQQLRAQHGGYRSAGESLACDFRLYATCFGQDRGEALVYQVALRRQAPDAELERRARKYLAWIELEQPFTAPVRTLQAILARRLLAPGWLADEYLAFPNVELRTLWQERIALHFGQTTGRIGFRDVPLEAGDFSAWMATGCHSERDAPPAVQVPVRAAATFADDEVDWLAGQRLAAQAKPATGQGADVFVSYASGDFALADATRRHLEDSGLRCWIAPRDINSGSLSYTEAIPRALAAVRAVVVLVSPASNLSVHVPREIDLALERRLPVVPLRVADLLPQGQLAYLLRTCQWLDLFGRDFDQAMAELLGRLTSGSARQAAAGP